MSGQRAGISLVTATALSVTVVIGAGLLVLPGTTFKHAGEFGFAPWLLVAVAMVPLLMIFAFFGSRYPSAGGVVGYIRASLGNRWGTASEVVLLGTFSLGLPAIALVGGRYLQAGFPAVPGDWVAAMIIGVALLAGLAGIRVSGAIQTAVAVAIIVGVSAVCIGFLVSTHPGPNRVGQVAPPEMSAVLAAVPAVLFAFTGWEMTAFLAEDMKNPQRDLPRSIWASFVIVVVLYVFVAALVARFGESTSEWYLAPVSQLAIAWLGSGASTWVGVIAAVLIIANVVAAFLSVSRFTYSCGRDGILPTWFARRTPQGEPALAMLVASLLFWFVIFLVHLDILSLETLLQLAGQNFFVLYFLVSIGYVVIRKGVGAKILGSITIAVVGLGLMLFSLTGAIYCGALLAVGYWLGKDTPVQG